MAAVPLDEAGLDEEVDDLLVLVEFHDAHEAGVEVAARDLAEFTDRLGDGMGDPDGGDGIGCRAMTGCR